MSTAFITHSDCLKHDMGTYHPECPARLSAIEDQLLSAGISGLIERVDAPLAKVTDLARVHPLDYIEAIRMASPAQGIVHLDPDTAMCPHTWTAALRAAGAAVLATDLVVSGRADNAFCSVRPPGHHATRERSMGFCIFNNVAVAVKHALEHHGLERVAVVDFDVHHGNGTEEVFSDDERVLMVSTFQHPFYPYSGTDNPARNMANVPLPAGTGSKGFREAVDYVWLPALERFRPQMLFISAGFDAHVEDDMAMLRLTESDYAWVTRQVKAIAERYAEGRIVSVLEGGYALSALGRSVVTHLKELGGL
ncbi:MAG: histone deacetylase family protein [Betaproteobacteria bacterium]|nr:histone deacetylase family protein [Betaproteobacteria bacterium]